MLGLSKHCSRLSWVELWLVTPHCNFWCKWKRIVTTFHPKCNNFWTRNVTRLAQNGTIFLTENITMQNATALKLLGQISFCQKCCNAVLRWKPSRETSLLLLQSSQKAKLLKLLNNNFSWKDNKRSWTWQLSSHARVRRGLKLISTVQPEKGQLIFSIQYGNP